MYWSRPTSRGLTATLAIVAALLSTHAALEAQSSSSRPVFSIEDALNVASFVQTDLSDDGRWLATVSTVRRDNFGVDYRRDGDPTYIRPSSGTVLVIETATGKSRAIFPDKRNVKSLAWSPDGARLAMLVVHNDAFEPVSEALVG
jgi:dipeptidyl aminopeptidase/acylaminoacyl peptidase